MDKQLDSVDTFISLRSFIVVLPFPSRVRLETEGGGEIYEGVCLTSKLPKIERGPIESVTPLCFVPCSRFVEIKGQETAESVDSYSVSTRMSISGLNAVYRDRQLDRPSRGTFVRP